MNRVRVNAALFNEMKELTGIKTLTRVLKHWSDVDLRQMPYVCLARGNDTPQQEHKLPTRWTLNNWIYVYVARRNADEAPTAVLDEVLDKIDSLFHHPSGAPNNLGLDEVERCWISGAIETDEGSLGDKAVAIIPIETLVKW